MISTFVPMPEIKYSQTIERINRFQHENKPFFFLVDFEKKYGFCELLKDIDPAELKFNFRMPGNKLEPINFNLETTPLPYTDYKIAFDQVLSGIEKGDSYICNLTFSTPVRCEIETELLFYLANAPYKVWMRDKFVVFSPEQFIRIVGNNIQTFPMKGTIKADLENAEEILRKNKKEKAEHNAIVDLLRNDLAMVCDKVNVGRFRYTEHITTHRGPILQMSSEITGKLTSHYQKHWGTLIDMLTPAGSISGAPKQSTMKLIAKAESHERSYYTGIAGLYMDNVLDTAVMIRYIEITKEGLRFKSGGGIHALSDPLQEYEELNTKIYVPVY
ncbi:MAG TPA: aminodeoxychorismate synthase component I [Saprospiraceae bacterium]|nr:aminodeoxychorismate synthase component I [Saprospiraceae bacterium]HNN67575.1 aminodeoxychorismate synthase component I [Saprospiraceae bacterium]